MSGGLYVTIVYGSAHLILGLILAFTLFRLTKRSGESLQCKDFFYRLWKMRGVYTPLIIHIYDTATDIGVLYEWYKLSEYEQRGDEYNIESLDMKQLFWIGIGFMIAYRSTLGILGCLYCNYTLLDLITFHDNRNACLETIRCCSICIFGTIIGFIGGVLELGLFVAIFFEQKDIIKQQNAIPAKTKTKTKSNSKNNNSRMTD